MRFSIRHSQTEITTLMLLSFIRYRNVNQLGVRDQQVKKVVQSRAASGQCDFRTSADKAPRASSDAG